MGTPGIPTPPEMIEKIRKLRSQGEDIPTIMKICKVSRQTVQRKTKDIIVPDQPEPLTDEKRQKLLSGWR